MLVQMQSGIHAFLGWETALFAAEPCYQFELITVASVYAQKDASQILAQPLALLRWLLICSAAEHPPPPPGSLVVFPHLHIRGSFCFHQHHACKEACYLHQLCSCI